MAQQPTTPLQRLSTNPDAIRVMVILVAALALAAMLTFALGIDVAGPAYDIVPDPAAALPF
jgi:hypothetical protein